MMSKFISKSMMFLCGGLLAPSVFASSITVPMYLTSDQGMGASAGQVAVRIASVMNATAAALTLTSY